ncbi:PadR family transcriptional regulator [Lactococcus garvieae]|jgi:DNA-binding PadR family transcriptional regulator|uniref:PadR family transcriptional regulator n=1 Tax=Lactococcus garvieae TaxID=1363 RepID=UPI0009BFC1DA|nr:PadR family transcriptional regulator [Lactococcus garvieae]QPS71822.1 PadR family transcriptional regulator [Lactococcus garvieae]
MASEDKLSYIILGLLKHEPLTGYDLKKNFESEVGEFWQANTGQIYPTLRKLFDAEAVDYDVEIVGAKLKKKKYHITDKGCEMFDQWIQTPAELYAFQKDEFMLRLYFLKNADDVRLIDLINEEIEVHKKKLNYLLQRQKLVFGGDDPEEKNGHFLVLDFAIQRENFRLDWLKSIKKSQVKRES